MSKNDAVRQGLQNDKTIIIDEESGLLYETPYVSQITIRVSKHASDLLFWESLVNYDSQSATLDRLIIEALEPFYEEGKYEMVKDKKKPKRKYL